MGEIGNSQSMRQEAAESVSDSGTTAPQTEIWKTTSHNSNQKKKKGKGRQKTCENQGILEFTTVENTIQTLSKQGFDSGSFNTQVVAIPELTIREMTFNSLTELEELRSPQKHKKNAIILIIVGKTRR